MQLWADGRTMCQQWAKFFCSSSVALLCEQYEHGDDRSLAAVVKMMPNKVKRRRKIQTESGVSA